MYPGKSNYFVTSNIVTDNAAAITSTLLENTHVIQVSRSFEPVSICTGICIKYKNLEHSIPYSKICLYAL